MTEARRGRADASAHHIDDGTLERALGRLPTVDLDPLAARAQLVAAEARLRARPAASSRLVRCEPALLSVLAGVQLAWALARVLAF
jgi:hypothetical protein